LPFCEVSPTNKIDTSHPAGQLLHLIERLSTLA
jgi:hypothetical protein